MKPSLITRRKFLKTSALGGAMAWTLPAFLDKTFFALHAAAQDSALQIRTGKDHPILVVLQLAGGNDGLNTVVPYGLDAYHRARPNLAIPSSESLRLGVFDGLGLNPSLSRIHAAMEEGKGCIVQNVGYPNPNRSHFRSMEIWQTAVDADRFASDGWIGRYFDNACDGVDADVGISFGTSLPQAFGGVSGKGVAMSADSRSGGSRPESFFMNDPGGEGDTISDFNMTAEDHGNVLDFLQRTELDAAVSEARIREAIGGTPEPAGFPPSRLGRQLQTVAHLIAGGMSTRVFYVSQGGYDTHNAQQPSHQRLLTELDAAVGAFLDSMKEMGESKRVLLMTFSEFGRRVEENASGGTDHGAAAPMFLFGGNIRAGIHGSLPDLADLDRGDLRYETDFRSVYATLLDDWLQTPHAPILGRNFQRLPLLAST
jgi:uncharacterized protein (DUF1501 family)